MKTFVKILLSVLLIAAIVTTVSLSIFAEDESVVDRINVTLNPLDADPTPDIALVATKAIIYNAMYDAHYNLTEDMEGYEALKARLMEKELDLLNAAIAEYYAEGATYQDKFNAVSWIKNVIEYGFTDLTVADEPADEPTGEPAVISDTTDTPAGEPTDEPTDTPVDEPTDEPVEKDIKTQVAELLADFEVIYAAKRAELESYVPVSEYENDVPGSSFDFEGATTLSPANLGTNIAQVVKNGKGSNGSNSYHEIIYFENLNTFIQPTFAGLGDSYVIEFDYTTFGAPLKFFSLTCADDCTVHGTACRYSRQWPMLIAFEGYNITNNNAGKGQVIGSIVPGQWTHISIVIDNVQDTFDVYINYELAEEDRSFAVATHDLNNLASIRIGSTNTDGRSFAVDSITGYTGTYPRTLDRITSMKTDEERYEFYAETLKNENASFTDRYISLNTVASNISKYYLDGAILPEYAENEQVNNIVSTYIAYAEETNPEAYTSIIEGYKSENLGRVNTMLDRYVNVGRNLDNIVSRTATLDGIDAFIKESVFDENSQGFKDAKGRIQTYRDEIAKDNAASAFVKAMFSFERAPTVSAKEKHYNTAATNYATFKNDIYNGQSLIEFYKNDTSKYPATDAGKTFIYYYTLYEGAKEELDAVVQKDNSNNFIVCISYVSGFTTEEDYEANFTEIKRLIEIAREMVYASASGNYFDESVEGFGEAMAHYERINSYFYEKLQLEHVSTLEAKLNSVINSDSYIERSGACTYVNNYLIANDVDTSREDIQNIIAKCDAFEKELGTQLEQYEELLEQNTTYFINTVSKISAASGYTAFRALYDEATEYYYKMNIDGEGVDAAILLYEKYRAEIDVIESESALFVAAVKSFANAKKRANQYKYLVECNKHIALAEAGIEGVSNAISTYNTCKANFDKASNAVNSEILETVNTMCTVRKDYDAAQSAVATKDIFE